MTLCVCVCVCDVSWYFLVLSSIVFFSLSCWVYRRQEKIEKKEKYKQEIHDWGKVGTRGRRKKLAALDRPSVSGPLGACSGLVEVGDSSESIG